MEYFRQLLDLLKKEKDAERMYYERLTDSLPVTERRAIGISWYPIVIKDTEMSVGDYLVVECERPTHQDIIHQFRFGMSVALFSNHDQKNDRVEGVVSHLSGNRMKVTLKVDDLPDWSRNGKLGIDAVFDKNSYEEMEKALRLAPAIAEKKAEGRLVRTLIGEFSPTFEAGKPDNVDLPLNVFQQEAVARILAANELAIVHGPPGTGKTTTLVQAIKRLLETDGKQVLAVAPSNTAVDLLTEKLAEAGMNVLRIGNPARVSDALMSHTLDSKIAAHPGNKEIKKLKRQANEYRELAHKYKRNFGPSERQQRKALFTEAHRILKDVEKIEQYIVDNLLSAASVITATLVGSNQYSIRNQRYRTVVIDEAGQALEPACWIPILKAEKLVLAGDHQQLPPVIKSDRSNGQGLERTLLEKLVGRYPEAVILLEEQYRMHEVIMQYSSQVFYNGRLQAAPTVHNHLIFPGDLPANFIDTAGCGFEELKEGNAISNPEEAAFLLKHLSDYLSHAKTQAAATPLPGVGVISPYKRQVELLKDEMLHFSSLVELAGSITINTIDSFQGQERDIVYISLVRSNAERAIGFLSELRRMNVAMTRAKKKLVVIGDSATLSHHEFYAGFIAYTQAQEAYFSAWEFM